MILLRWRKHAPPAPSATVDPEAAAEAVKASQQHLEEEQDKMADVQRVGGSLRALRERNHFAELWAATMVRE